MNCDEKPDVSAPQQFLSASVLMIYAISEVSCVLIVKVINHFP